MNINDYVDFVPRPSQLDKTSPDYNQRLDEGIRKIIQKTQNLSVESQASKEKLYASFIDGAKALGFEPLVEPQSDGEVYVDFVQPEDPARVKVLDDFVLDYLNRQALNNVAVMFSERLILRANIAYTEAIQEKISFGAIGPIKKERKNVFLVAKLKGLVYVAEGDVDSIVDMSQCDFFGGDVTKIGFDSLKSLGTRMNSSDFNAFYGVVPFESLTTEATASLLVAKVKTCLDDIKDRTHYN